MDEEDLLEAAVTDPEALNELAQCFYERLHCYFEARFAPDVAEDLAQNTLVVMLEKLDGFERQDQGTFSGWVFGIAERQCLQHWAKESRNERLRAALAPVDRTPERALASFIQLMKSADLLDQEISKLSEAQQREIAFFYAKARGEEPNSKHSHATLLRALASLRKQLGMLMATPAPPPS